MSSCLWQKLIAKRYSDITKAEIDVLNQAWIDAPYLFQSVSSSVPTVEPASTQPRKRQRTNSGDSSTLSNNVVARHQSQDQQSDRLSDRQPDRRTPAPTTGPSGSISSASAASTSVSGPSVASLLQDSTAGDTPASSQGQVTTQAFTGTGASTVTFTINDASHGAGTNCRNSHNNTGGFNSFHDFNMHIFHNTAPDPLWRPHALAATESLGVSSEDARFLFLLLSFLAPRVPVSLLVRGATPRKRWSTQGDIEMTNADTFGLASELIDLLSDEPQLRYLLRELVQAQLLVCHDDATYSAQEDVAAKLRNGLPTAQLDFWRFQAVVVSYRSIPWKYLEPINLDMKNGGYTRHIEHVLEAASQLLPTCRDFFKADLVLSLLEASRLPTMRWKRFAINRARFLAKNLELHTEDDENLRSRMAEAEAVLHRLSGNTAESTRALDSLSNISNGGGSLLLLCHKRLHASLGLVAAQHALNAVQSGDVLRAQSILDDWRPIGSTSCPLEEVVVVRKYIIMGRMNRSTGRFKDARTCLKHTQGLINRRTHGLVYGEEMRDLVCELADTLRELDDTVDAEHRLRAEIAEDRPEKYVFPGKALLQLSLAETLFAQQQYCEADQLCRDIRIQQVDSKSTPGTGHRLLKAERLRLSITLAKLRHVQQDDNGALPFWIESLSAASKMPLDAGGTVRVIIASITDILDRRSSHPGKSSAAASASRPLNATLPHKIPRAPYCYIAGLSRWSEYLRANSKDAPRTRLRLGISESQNGLTSSA